MACSAMSLRENDALAKVLTDVAPHNALCARLVAMPSPATQRGVWRTSVKQFRYNTRCNILILMSGEQCSSAGYHKVLKEDLRKLDVTFRGLLESVVSLPDDVEWTRPGDEIMRIWNR